MKRIIISAAMAAVALLSFSCAKNTPAGPNDADKRYFEAWLQVNNITTKPSELGIYILEDEPGTGVQVEENGFVFVEYSTRDLEGNITSYTDMKTAQQLGAYDPDRYSTFYGPQFLTTYKGNIYAGLADMIFGMKAGGHRKAIIPSWLLSYNDFDNESDYLSQATKNSTLIYDVTVKDFTKDIDKWEIDSIGRFFSNDRLLIDGIAADKIFTNANGTTMTTADSVQTGFYYKQIKAPADTAAFAKDTTIYINYTGRLLNGQVFDTTIEDVAKDNRIFSSSRTYEPVLINWSNEEESTYKGISMGTDESSIIPGFALTLWQMRPMEKGIGIFYSPLGYGTSGSGGIIPAYSPLIFEIEIVDKPED